MQQIVLRAVLTGAPQADDFVLREVPLPACPADGVLVRVCYLSLDPYVGAVLRGRHIGHRPVEPMVDPVPGAIVGQVIESRIAGVAPGDWIHSEQGAWQDHVALAANRFTRLEPGAVPLSTWLGVLGLPGLTAWASARRIAKVTPGDIVLVNAAAGPVGGTFGQLARIAGAARVIGIAGVAEKCALACERYGFDSCIDYHRDGWQDALRIALPDGLSVFHENVSAAMAMEALALARPYARGVLCGLAAGYQAAERPSHALDAGVIVGRRAQVSGLVVYDFLDQRQAFIEEVLPLVAGGRLHYAEDRASGLAAAPAHFARLMRGENVGKALVVVAGEGG